MIGKKIKEIRLAADLTQKKFGERIGIKPDFVSHLERGKAYPSYLLLEKIIDEFNVDTKWLFNKDKK
ncbi:MAG: helix-turn-helix transcriptional regulator [Magnetococcales bacterium]|nr:helix-turn-helix transcriptional regulator [Nitrospirota bacterium]